MDKNKKVVISGAGIAGLTSAIWLGKNGFKPVVVEKSPAIRAHGFIVSLSHKSYQFARELGILQKLRDRGAGIKESCYYDKKNRAMLTLDYQKLFQGLDIVQIMRDELEMVLYEEARNLCEFRFDNSLSKVVQEDGKVHLELKDGSTDTCDVLIGADGLHSVTRSLVFGESEFEKKYFGIFSSAYRLNNVLDLEDRFENHMEQNRYMCVYTTGEGDLACVFIWKSDKKEAPLAGDRLSMVRNAYKGCPDTVQKVIDNHPNDDEIYIDPLIQVKMNNWYKGNVVLLGDAAHCLTLLSGQGASTAFWDASVLANSLINHSPEDAFKNYQSEIMPVTKKIQLSTRNASKWYIPEKIISYYSRDFAMRFLPNAFFQKYFRNKYSSA
jgi:2-polyprenyl-6-methoxyphenol hydroxylase-like FAD-dependent oxidoreductase